MVDNSTGMTTVFLSVEEDEEVRVQLKVVDEGEFHKPVDDQLTQTVLCKTVCIDICIFQYTIK
jgi:hypothetical protein